MSFEDWQQENKQVGQPEDGYEAWSQSVDQPMFRGTGDTGIWKEQENVATRIKKLPERVVGGLARGTMHVAKALTRLPEMAIRQVGMVDTASLAIQVLREKDPQKRKAKLFRMGETEKTYIKIANELGRAGDLQQIGQNVIERNHPEWQYDPPRGFKDLLLSPDKTAIMLAESTPLLVAAGIFTAAGQPQLSVALMYAAEGQSAFDSAKQYGATDEQATAAYAMYAPIAAILEQLQLGHVMKIGKGMFNHVLHRTAAKMAGKTITKQLVTVAATEAIEEISQGQWEDVTAKVIYGKPLGSLKEIVDRRAQEGYLGGLLGLIPGVGGLTLGKTVATIRGKKHTVQKETPKAEQLGDIKAVKETIQESPNLTPEEKAVGEQYVGDIETKIVNKIVERFPGEITDQTSLKDVGDKIAAWLGIKQKINWKWSKRPSKTMAGQTWRARNEITIYPNQSQKDIKETIVHELGHYTKPPFRAKESPGKRKVHHPEFKKWVEDNVKQLTKSIEQGVVPIHREEAVGPIKKAPIPEAVKPDVINTVATTHNEQGGSTTDIKTGEAVTKGYAVSPYKDRETVLSNKEVTPEQIEDFANKNKDLLEKPGHTIGTWFNSEDGKTYLDIVIAETSKEKALEIAQENNQLAIFDLETFEEISVPAIKEKLVKKPSRKRLLTLGHKIAKQAGWGEDQRRDFMENVTGKRSMKDMTKPEMQKYVDALQEETGITPTVPKKKGTEPLLLGDRTTTMNEIMGDAAVTVDGLPEKVNIPEHVKRTFLRKLRGGIGKKLKHIGWGIDNSPLYQLANILGNGKDSIFTEVFDTIIQKARRVEAAHKRSAVSLLNQAFEDAGITPHNLSEISNSVNPRFTWYQFLQEKFGEGTKIISIKLNNKTYDMNYGELLDVYLIAQQEQGMKHLLGGGLIINGVETGALSEKDIGVLNAYITRNDKLQTIADAFTATQENIWKPSLNQTALELGEKPIATVENWWGLEVYYPKQLPGKKQQFNVNLLENKSIFLSRTKSKRPLVVRDAFQRFLTFENAIAEYVAFAEPLRTARTVINNPDLAAATDKKGFKDVWDNIRTILDRTQSLQRPSGKFEALVAKMLPGVYRAVLYFNPRVILSQYTSVANYEAFISTKYMNLITKGISSEGIQETLRLSNIAWDRFYMGHSSYELGEIGASDAVLKFFTETSSDINKLGVSLKYADIAALTAGMEIAKAEYKDAQNETIAGDSAQWWAGKDISSEEGSQGWEQAITSRAEWLWQRSQPSWDKWNRSVLTSDPSAIRRLFFLFRSFHEKSLAILQSAHTEYANSNKTTDDTTRFAKKYGAVLSSYAINTVLRALVMIALRKKIKEPFEYFTDIITAPFAMLPILGKILQMSLRSFTNAVTEHAPEYRGEAIESLPIRVMNTIAKAPDNFARAAGYFINGDTEKAERSLKKAIGALYEGIGTAEGVPVNEIRGSYKGWIKEEEPGGRQRRSRSE